MKTISLLLLLFVFGTTQAQILKTFIKTGKAPLIDGICDDNDPWFEDGWMDLAYIKEGSIANYSSAKMQMLFSKDIGPETGFIYLIIEVEDETPSYDTTITNTSERDCVEIYFDMDTNAWANHGAYKNGSWQIRCQRKSKTGNYLDGNSHANTGNIETLINSTDFKWAVENNSSEYTMEFAFPVAVLAKGAKFDGKFLRFDLKMVDNTTGYPKGVTFQVFWNNTATDNQWKDTRDFGLVEEYTRYVCGDCGPNWPTQIPNATSSQTEKGIAFVNNNQLEIKNVLGAITLYNLYGEALQKSTINGNGSIDISNFTPGIYFVKGNNLRAKFVK